MPDDIDRIFQTVHHKSVSIETLLPKAVEHGGALVEDCALPLEDAAETAGGIAMLQHPDTKPPFCQKTRRR